MPAQTYHEIEIPSICTQAKKAEDGIIAAARTHGYGEEDIFALRLSLEEALSNAIRHGNKQDPDKSITIRYYVNRDRIDIYIADEGTGFNPIKVPDPTTAENLERPHGRGILLMRAYMNLVEYNNTGNVIHIVKLNDEPDK
ncbi:MAG: ATP-binding protein [Sedimentisphaerales bacterium]|nr:ATP-binding protein [Sedimentisphaerales bacterium]